MYYKNSFAFLAAALCLCACDRSAVPSLPASAEVVAGNGESVELVQLEHGDPPGRRYEMTRDVNYAMCKSSAEMLKLPVKPFPPMPVGYGETRTTTITNGKSMVTKTETNFEESDEAMRAESGCEYRITAVKSVSVQIMHKERMINLEGKNGTLAVTSDEDAADAPEWSKGHKTTTEYTQARTMNGVLMRCLPANFWTLNTNQRLDMRELCVYATDGVVIDLMREPIIVMSHVLVNVLNPKYQEIVKLEPLSFRKLNKSDPDPYEVSTWKK